MHLQCSKLINWTQILKKWTKNRPIFPQKTDQNRPVKNQIQTPFRIFLLFIGKNNAFLIFCLIIIQQINIGTLDLRTDLTYVTLAM